MSQPRWKTVLVVLSAIAATGLCVAWAVRDERPGDASVYDRIERETSCERLQAEFDTADAGHRRDLDRGRADLAEVGTSYMEAADNRMREIGCYR